MNTTELIVETLKGNRSGKRPVFAPYENKVKAGESLERLLERGMGLIKRVSVYRTRNNKCKVRVDCSEKNGEIYKKTVVETPYGNIDKLEIINKYSTYLKDHFIKADEDYKAYKYYIEDTELIYNGEMIEHMKNHADYYFLRGQLPYEPLQQLIAQDMGTEKFCYEWIDNREKVEELFESLLKFNEKTYDFAVKSNLPATNYGGNVVPNIIGKDTFKNLYVPVYNNAADVLHGNEQFIGSHFDADNRLILEDIAASKLDYIEAYDTSCNYSLSEAIKVAPDKVFWLNFPSPAHLWEKEKIYNLAMELIKEGAKAKGLIIGVTEDVPEHCWEKSYSAIMDALDDFYGKDM